MRSYTVHLKPVAAPVLLREGFSWGALFFGPFWLAGAGAWIAAALLLLGWAVLLAALHGSGAAPLCAVALCLWQGLAGRDLCRWNLERRGYVLSHVVNGRDELGAWARLLAARPDLVAWMDRRAW